MSMRIFPKVEFFHINMIYFLGKLQKLPKYICSRNQKGDVFLKSDNTYLTCEKNWVFFTLMTIAGFFGAYTYLLRGNVFCNAQTGNVVLLGMALGAGKWTEALYYLIPISAYLLGAFASELLPNPVKHVFPIRWDTLLIAIEMIVVAFLGFLPESAPVQISQVAINFIASMQYNTFRQAEGVPMATTFATNHIRQIGVGLAKEIRHSHDPEKAHRKKLKKHSLMLVCFLSGATVGTVFCDLFLGKAIWIVLIPFANLLRCLVRDDLRAGKDNLERKPLGH